jgi:hypothetical protein
LCLLCISYVLYKLFDSAHFSPACHIFIALYSFIVFRFLSCFKMPIIWVHVVCVSIVFYNLLIFHRFFFTPFISYWLFSYFFHYFPGFSHHFHQFYHLFSFSSSSIFIMFAVIGILVKFFLCFLFEYINWRAVCVLVTVLIVFHNVLR